MNLREAIENAAQPVKLTGKSLDRIVAAVEAFYQKDKPEYGNHDVNTILDAFKNAFGTTKSTRYDRFAATRLIKLHGVDAVHVAILGLANGQGDKFCPSVNNVSQLEEKWPSVVRFLRARWEGAREIEL